MDDLIDDTEDPALGVLHRQCQVAHVLGLSSPASASISTTSFSSALPSPSPSPAAYYSTLASKSAQTTAPSSVMPSPFTQIDIFDNNDCNIPSLNMPLAPSSLLSLPFSTLASAAVLQEMNTTLESERRERLVSMTVSALVSLLQADEPVATQEEEENEQAEQTGYETVGDATGIESSSDEEHGEDDDDDDDQGEARGRALSSADEQDDQESQEDEEDEESNPKRRSEAQGRAVRFVPRRRARTDSSRSSRSVSQVSGKDRVMVNAPAVTVGSAEDCQSLSSRSGAGLGVGGADGSNVPGLQAT